MALAIAEPAHASPIQGRLYNRGLSDDMVTASSAAATAPVDPSTLSYEEALAELERLVVMMEGGQLPLDGLLDGYRRGGALLEACRSRLEAVEQQVKLLEEGQLKPWTAA